MRYSNPHDQLTGAERAMMKLLAEGLDRAAIAERLGVTRRTLNKRMETIKGKLYAETEKDAVRAFTEAV